VMLDVVANHMGPTAAITENQPSPLEHDATYHSACEIDYTDQTSVEQCWLYDLPDVRTEDPNIRQLYNTWVRNMVSEYKFDGLRIDTVKHVENDFWPGFVQSAGVYAIGEVSSGDPAYIAEYAQVMPGLLDYATYYPLNRVFQQLGTFQQLVSTFDRISRLFPDPTVLGNFIDNHDNERFLNQKNDLSLLENALAYVILARGIPIVYYGTEQGFVGGKDPANREDLWRSGYDTHTGLYDAISRLSAARKAADGLTRNDHEHLYVRDSAYAWSRAAGKLIVLVTNTGRGTTGHHCFGSRQDVGTVYNDISGKDMVVVKDDGQICVDVSNGEPVVLLRG